MCLIKLLRRQDVLWHLSRHKQHSGFLKSKAFNVGRYFCGKALKAPQRTFKSFNITVYLYADRLTVNISLKTKLSFSRSTLALPRRSDVARRLGPSVALQSMWHQRSSSTKATTSVWIFGLWASWCLSFLPAG